MSWENLFMSYANNMRICSLIGTFVVRCLDRIIPILADAKISRLAEQAGLSLTWSDTLKSVFSWHASFDNLFLFSPVCSQLGPRYGKPVCRAHCSTVKHTQGTWRDCFGKCGKTTKAGIHRCTSLNCNVRYRLFTIYCSDCVESFLTALLMWSLAAQAARPWMSDRRNLEGFKVFCKTFKSSSSWAIQELMAGARCWDPNPVGMESHLQMVVLQSCSV